MYIAENDSDGYKFKIDGVFTFERLFTEMQLQLGYAIERVLKLHIRKDEQRAYGV